MEARKSTLGNKSSRTDIRENSKQCVECLGRESVGRHGCFTEQLIAAILRIYTTSFSFACFFRPLRLVFGQISSWHTSLRSPFVRYGNHISGAGAPVQTHRARCQDHAIESRLESIFLLIQIRVTMPTNISNCVVTLAECWFSFFSRKFTTISFIFYWPVSKRGNRHKSITHH